MSPEDFRCFCGEPFRVEDPEADGYWPSAERRRPDLRGEGPVGVCCPECGTDLAEAYLEQIEQEICQECGCTDEHACFDPSTELPCYWVEPGLCSTCAFENAWIGGTDAEDDARRAE